LLYIFVVSTYSAELCMDDDYCYLNSQGTFSTACSSIDRFASVSQSKLFVSDMLTSDNNRLVNSVSNARNWVKSVAASSIGQNDTVVYPDKGDMSQLRMDLNVWCCLTVQETSVIAGILSVFQWNRITVKLDQTACIKVLQPMDGPQAVTLAALPNPAGQTQLLTLVRKIEALVAAQMPTIPLVNPRSVSFHVDIATVHMGLFPVQDALNYLLPSSTTSPTDQSWGTVTIQAINFGGNLYYAQDATFATVNNCPDCNSSTSTMIAAILIFVAGMGTFYGCYYYREKIKKLGHDAKEAAQKALRPHGQSDSAYA